MSDLAFEAFVIDGAPLDIRPASRRRDWMDETMRAFAYRCVPLTMANTHGWEIRCPHGFEAEWDGGSTPEAVRITADDATEPMHALPHFGHGILSFSHEVIFRTPPGYNLWVTGPVNRPKDAIAPLSGLVEADWMPFTFSMNWRFTRPNTPVRFEKGEPYCHLFPVPRGLVGSIQPSIEDIDTQPEMRRQYEIGKRKREFRRVVEHLRPGFESPEKMRFQGWYARGVMPDESPANAEHELPHEAPPFTVRSAAVAGPSEDQADDPADLA